MVKSFDFRGFTDHIYLKKFTYDQYFQLYDLDKFLVDLFNSGILCSSKDTWRKLGKVTKVETQEMLHDVISLEFFDRLYANGIVRENHDIVKCFDEYHDQFLVSDLLRKCLIMPEFENFDVFSETDRKQVIFHLFKALCLGGSVCQFEDSLLPYLDVTKAIYKDFVSYNGIYCRVARNPTNNELKVTSLVFKVLATEGVSNLFPSDHVQNFCYVSIDPQLRHVNILYHGSDSYY